MAQLLQFYKSFQQNQAPKLNAAPTFDDLSIDTRLGDLQRLNKYAKSTIALQRVVHVRMLADIARASTLEQIITEIFPLINIFSNDVEAVIRHNFVEQLTVLATICVERGPQGYEATKLELLPAAVLLLEDVKEEVQKSALICVAHMAKLIHREDVGEHLLTLILRLAHDDEKVEMRVAASELLNLVAEYLGCDLCKQFVFPEILSLAEDPDFRVRKSVALNFCNICKMGGEFEVSEKLIPVFVTLSQDEMFRVRKACADSLFATSQFVSEEIRIGVLLPIFKSLAQDQSKFVKESIYKASGMFISSLPSIYISASILGHYISCLSEPIGDSIIDSEIKIQAAYSFPGVLQTVGKARWNELKQVYHTLAQSRLPSIRQTIAASLHEVAKILSSADNDQALVERELVPVFEDMLQDSDDLQIGVVKNIVVFLKCLSVPIRLTYLPMIHDIVDLTKYRWRLRQVLCTQLADLIDLCPKTDVYTNLFPLVMELLQDTIVSVRSHALKGISKLIIVLNELVVSTSDNASSNSKAVKEFDDVIQTINAFVRRKTYTLRQLWVQICAQLLRDLPQALFEKHFVDGILILTTDRVSNVRIAVSQLLSGWDDDLVPSTIGADGVLQPNSSSPWSWLLNRQDISECVNRLAHEDLDVFSYITRLKPYFPTIEFQAMSCRGRKIAPGGNSGIALNNSNNNSNSNSRDSSGGGGGGNSGTSNGDSSNGDATAASDVVLENLDSKPPVLESKDSFFGEAYGDLRALSAIQAHSLHHHTHDDKETIEQVFKNLDLTHLEPPPEDGLEGSTDTTTSPDSSGGEQQHLETLRPDAEINASGGSASHTATNLQDIEDLLDTMDMGFAPHHNPDTVHQPRKSE